uniref:Uncharacterized protein n=1 Tax=Hyaloperonospora arabidopsidis (strain Emoy2) TaxID=559515 RepID=M4BN37_HYAAE
MLRRVWQRAGMWQSPSRFFCAVAVNKKECVLPHRHDSASSRTETLRPRTRTRSPVNRTLPITPPPRGPNQLNVLLSNQTSPTTFVATCRALRAIDETALLATIDVRTWNVALQRRLEAQDERGAAELLAFFTRVSNGRDAGALETVEAEIRTAVCGPRARRRGQWLCQYQDVCSCSRAAAVSADVVVGDSLWYYYYYRRDNDDKVERAE